MQKKNNSPTKNINKVYKEMTAKRAQSTDKGYKRTSISGPIAVKNNVNQSQQNNTIN